MKIKKFKDITFKELKNISLIISDFDGVFTDNSVYVQEDGTEHVRCTRADGIGLSKLKKTSIKVIVVSSEINDVVLKRCDKLGLEAYNNIKNKGDFIDNYLIQNNLTKKNVIYVGNDENDITALDHAAIKVGVKDSFHEYQKRVSYLLESKGGYGAIRELCDKIINELKNE